MNTASPLALDHDQQIPGHFLSDISAQPLQWLWQNRIPFAHLTLLHGTPGIGLSLFAIHLAACVSAGQLLPDGSACPQGNVIIIAPFDAPAHTIKPRLEAAGGDPSHVLLLNSVPVSSSHVASHHSPSGSEQPFSLAHDLSSLETAIQRTHARLVIIDSPEACRDPLMRPILPRLAQLAQRTNCAILLVRPLTRPLPIHFNPAHLHTLPLLPAVHSALLIVGDPDDDQERLLISTKHSLSPSSPILSYEITVQPSGVPALNWLGEVSTSSDSSHDTQVLRSFQRQFILDAMHDSPTPLTAQEITELCNLGYEAARKMLQRMTHDGELLSPARGLYTTPTHPSLADFPHLTTPVPIVSNVPHPENALA